MPRASRLRKDYMDAQNPNPPRTTKPKPTVGSLFAGIGGFDLGFEQAGFATAWQVEINDVCREVLRDRFPHAAQFADVRTVLPELWRTDVIVGGFPCQDVSTMGKRAGLAGERTGLFFDAVRIVQHLQPRFLVLENVHGLLSSNDGRDFETVLETLAECGYVGYWRVLNARYFGVPQNRRRVFIVAGLGELPPLEFMADARPVGDVLGESQTCPQDCFPTQLAGFPGAATVDLSCSCVLAVPGARHQMVERQRASADFGLCLGLAAADLAEARAAGNAVVPQVARWIADKLIQAF